MQLIRLILWFIIHKQFINYLTSKCEDMSIDNLPVALIFLTCDFEVKCYLNPANCNKVLGMTLHPSVGSVAQNLATTGHPQALNQRTTTRESFVSQHFSPKRMDDGIMEWWNASHLPPRLLNRANIGRRTTCTHSMCQHETLLLSCFILLFLLFDSFTDFYCFLVLFLFIFI